jgi:hypothetical protein
MGYATCSHTLGALALHAGLRARFARGLASREASRLRIASSVSSMDRQSSAASRRASCASVSAHASTSYTPPRALMLPQMGSALSCLRKLRGCMLNAVQYDRPMYPSSVSGDSTRPSAHRRPPGLSAPASTVWSRRGENPHVGDRATLQGAKSKAAVRV